jgi:hypothetical protein
VGQTGTGTGVGLQSHVGFDAGRLPQQRPRVWDRSVLLHDATYQRVREYHCARELPAPADRRESLPRVDTGGSGDFALPSRPGLVPGADARRSQVPLDRDRARAGRASGKPGGSPTIETQPRLRPEDPTQGLSCR